MQSQAAAADIAARSIAALTNQHTAQKSVVDLNIRDTAEYAEAQFLASVATKKVGISATESDRQLMMMAARLSGFGSQAEQIGGLAAKFNDMGINITKCAGALAAFGIGWKIGAWIGDVTSLNEQMQEAYGDVFFGREGKADTSAGDRAKKQRLAIEGTKDWTKEDSAEDVITKKWREQAGKDWRKEGGLADKIAAKDPETMARYKAEVQAENERRELEKQQAARANVTPAQRDALMADLQKRMDAELVKGGKSDEYQRLSGLKDDAESGKLAGKYYGKNLADQVALEDTRTQAEADKLKKVDDELADFFGSVAEGAKKITDLKDDLKWSEKLAGQSGDKQAAAMFAAEQKALADGTLSKLGNGDINKGLSRFRDEEKLAIQANDSKAVQLQRPGSMLRGSQEAFTAQLGPVKQDPIRATENLSRVMSDLKVSIDRAIQGGNIQIIGKAA